MPDWFKKLFDRETEAPSRAPAPDTSTDAPGVFLGGAYRPHREEDIERFTALACEAFPELQTRIRCFGADWGGSQFATDTGRLVDGKPQILLLEPGTGQALEIPADFTSFHETELLQQPDAVAGYSFFKDWLASGGAVPAYDQCVSYKKPLYLGGVNDVENLELCSFEVYWVISAQLLAQVRGLPPGTKINSVKITD